MDEGTEIPWKAMNMAIQRTKFQVSLFGGLVSENPEGSAHVKMGTENAKRKSVGLYHVTGRYLIG